MSLGQGRKELSGLKEMFLLGRSAEGDDDFVEIRDLSEVLHDALDRGRPQLGRGDWKNEGDAAVTAEFDELLLHPVQAHRLKPVKSRDDSGLIKISHGNLQIWILQPVRRSASARTATDQPMGPSPGARIRVSVRMDGAYRRSSLLT